MQSKARQNKTHLLVGALLCVCAMPPFAAHAQLVGTDNVPGTACSAKGSVQMTANATGPGAYILTCDGDAPLGKWVATINAELPTANAQVANKEYVDSAVAAGGSCSAGGPTDCRNIGDLCADGTVFAGYHPTLNEALFIPTTDQGTTSAWKTSTGVNDIATDSTYDGRANTNQVANSTTFPAFKLCKDLTTGGYSDWYLPAQVEAYYLWSVRGTIEAGGNITNFQNAIYWSSTEYGTSNAWFQYFPNGAQDVYAKNNALRVRCVRR